MKQAPVIISVLAILFTITYSTIGSLELNAYAEDKEPAKAFKETKSEKVIAGIQCSKISTHKIQRK